MRQTPLHLSLAVLAVTLTSLPAEESLVVHPSSAVAEMSEDQLREVYLGRRTSWEDGSKVVVVVVKDGPSLDHLMAHLGKSYQQFSTGWKKLVFTGKAAMPEQADSDEAAVALVARTPGAIGYVDSAKAKDGVKVVPLK